jgi:antitoxin ParD1/3/4
MKTMSISLPDPLKEYVEELVGRGDYRSASEYIHTLICEDRKRRETERLEAMLLEGLSSGPMTEMTPEDWESIRQEVRGRLAELNQGANGQAAGEDR